MDPEPSRWKSAAAPQAMLACPVRWVCSWLAWLWCVQSDWSVTMVVDCNCSHELGDVCSHIVAVTPE